MITLRYGPNGPFAAANSHRQRAANQPKPTGEYEPTRRFGTTEEMLRSAYFYENVEALGQYSARPTITAE